MTHLSKAEAEEFYNEHAERSFYQSLIDYMTSGPVMIQIFEGENAITVLRNIMGSTIPGEAKEGTIRNLYGNFEAVNGTYQNAIHGSDSKKNAEREINFFFSKNDWEWIFSRRAPNKDWEWILTVGSQTMSGSGCLAVAPQTRTGSGF